MKTILAVDDSASARRMVKITLAAAGRQAIEAGDSRDGSTRSEANAAAAIAADLRMRNINGLEFICGVGKQPPCRGVPIMRLKTESNRPANAPDSRSSASRADAGARPYVSCALNVRGNVIPLADFRARFGAPPASMTSDSRFIVPEIDLAGAPTIVSMAADEVFEVADLGATTAHSAAPIGMRRRPEFVAAIAKQRDAFIIVPNIKQILN